MYPIKVTSRLGEINGFSNGKVAYFDHFDAKSNKEIRHFILLEESIKLMYEPWGWKCNWYADLIRIDIISENQINLIDLYIDIIIESNNQTYRIIDLDDFANAIVNDLICYKDIKTALNNLQSFLDNYLHNGKDFPPNIIIPFII
jgi:predicted RNA-binding protein associated with RNAse of E/G family